MILGMALWFFTRTERPVYYEGVFWLERQVEYYTMRRATYSDLKAGLIEERGCLARMIVYFHCTCTIL